MANTIATRMGDGERVKMSPSEVKAELQRGAECGQPEIWLPGCR